MKKIVILIAMLVAVVACSRKTIPPATTHVITTPGHADTSAKVPPTVVNADTSTAAPVNSNAAVLVVSDANGKIIVSEGALPPDAGVKFDYLELSKGFTPQQKINLNTRYKMIPPRVLYVAKSYQLSSLRGVYYIYKKKFWYWKKKDGLFYLDEKYYL